MEHPAYRENLEQILAFTGGRHLLNIKDVKAFTGLKDYRPFIGASHSLTATSPPPPSPASFAEVPENEQAQPLRL